MARLKKRKIKKVSEFTMLLTVEIHHAYNRQQCGTFILLWWCDVIKPRGALHCCDSPEERFVVLSV